MTQPRPYTTQLQAGLGMINETRALLDIWRPGMDAPALKSAALASGRFPGMSARRLRNLVAECFAPRFLVDSAAPARILSCLKPSLTGVEFSQLLFLHTCRAHAILADFVRDVYWPAYAGGRVRLDNDEAREFVRRANQDGRTAAPWAPSTIRRVGGYLTSCCADFGLLEGGTRKQRRILAFTLQPRVAAVLAYELHFQGLGDNSVLAHPDWGLFGLDRADALSVLKRLTLQGRLIVQAAGDVTAISWTYGSMEALVDVLAEA